MEIQAETHLHMVGSYIDLEVRRSWYWKYKLRPICIGLVVEDLGQKIYPGRKLKKCELRHIATPKAKLYLLEILRYLEIS